MVTPTQTLCAQPAVQGGYIVCHATISAGIQAGIGALTALAFTAICPAAAVIPAVGAIFGAVMGGTSALTTSLTSPSLYMEPQAIERSWISTGDGIPYAVAQIALAIIVGALAATAFTMAIGLPITFAVALPITFAVALPITFAVALPITFAVALPITLITIPALGVFPAIVTGTALALTLQRYR